MVVFLNLNARTGASQNSPTQGNCDEDVSNSIGNV